MQKQKNKFGYMLVGVLIGVLIAFSIVWWQGNDIGNWKLIKKVKSYFSSIFSKSDDNHVTVISEKSKEQNKTNAKQNANNSELENDSAYYDTTNVDLYDPNALDEFLARYNGQLPDSLVLDSIIKSQNNIDINSYSNSNNNVEVKKDRLIFAKSFNVPGIDLFSEDNPGKLDSLLTDNKTNVSDRNKNILLVEFWKSPINYKGYKTGKNKLVLFGIDQYDIITFKALNNSLYMKYLSDYYQIDRSIEFRSLIPVNNPQLLSQLSK